ncbi:MAG: hypothetical protein IT196_25375 [Acidimicrobiales bacterium]|nr:hypothetical protein [Acidimicrobiales bacterium]
MAFGQSSGPPATARQLAQLLALLQEAGHADFRDARGPLGFTQRQAGGKFTRDEAEQLIAQLDATDADTDETAAPAPPLPRRTAADKLLEGIPTATLAAELQRRGWVVLEP